MVTPSPFFLTSMINTWTFLASQHFRWTSVYYLLHTRTSIFIFIPQLWTISLKYFICPLTCFGPAHYSITLSFQEFLFESCDENWRLPTIPKKSIYQSKNINYTLIFMNSKFLDATAKENCFNKSVKSADLIPSTEKGYR